MTKSKKHHWLFRLWVKIRGLMALLIVLAGICVGLLSLLLPFESLYQKQLEAFLEKQWGLNVAVEEIEGSWHGYGPYFSLKNLSLSGKQTVDLEAASLSINIYQLLIPGGRTGIDLSINKAELGMIQSEKGATITINNEQDEDKFTEMLDRVLESGSLRVNELVLNIADQQGGIVLAGLTADFLLEQDLSNRAFQLLVQNENKDQNIEIKSISSRTETLSKNAKWHIKFNQFELAQIDDLVSNMTLPDGVLQGELWLTAKNGYISSATGQLDWSSADSVMSFQLSINHQGDDKNWLSHWRIDRLRINNETFADIDFWGQREGDFSSFKIDTIPINFITLIQSELKPLPTSQQALLNQLNGVLSPVELVFDDSKNLVTFVAADFTNLSLTHEDLDLSGISGTVNYANHNVSVQIDSNKGHLAIPSIYREMLLWDELTAQFDVDLSNEQQVIELNSLWCDCQDFDLNVWSHVNLAATNSIILTSKLTDVTVNQLWKYWPHNVWKSKTLNWLDTSLIDGKVEQGYVFVHGELIPKLFKTGAAQFISRAYVRETTNKFRPDWPAVENLNATALFTHDSVHVDVDQAVTKGVHVGKSQVNIESLDVGLLSVELTASAQNNQVLDYLNQSPLSKNIKLSDSITLTGNQNIDLGFDVSLKDTKPHTFDPNGTITFNNGTFATEHFSLDQINGPVKLSGYELKMKDLPAALETAPVTLNGTIVTKSDEGVKINVDIDGELEAQYILGKINQELPIEGESNWQIHLKNQQDDLLMEAVSDLTGVSIELPAPLQKDTEENQLLTIKCTIPCEQSTVEINYADKITSTIQADAGKYHLSQLNFIDPEYTPDTDNPFGGYIEELDLDQWLELVTDAPTQSTASGDVNDLPFTDISLRIKNLLFMSRRFEDVDLQISRKVSSFEVKVDSPGIKGLVIIADDINRKGIVGQFEYLNWIDTIDFEEIKSVNQQTSVPDLHLWVENFSYLDIPLGQLRMEMRNVVDGIVVEQLSIKSELAEIQISGAWHEASGHAGESEFNVVMFSEKIADFLQTVGFAAPITNAQTLIKMNAVWQGPPSDFDMAKVDGELDIKIGQGQVLDQKPGFGRVLGLFNLTNLPRRLILDFRDVLAEGLLFRSMEGHFVINQGVANTQDFLIKASSAKIHLNGDVGFADQSYDQIITIRPQIGKTFPTIGAIAGGPVGAAAGFLVQGLFNKQLKNKNEIIYRVTGTWDEPVIELISNE